MTEETLRGGIVRTAQSWIGLKEQDGSHHLIVALYNSYRPRPRGYVLTDRDAWCAATVSALSIVSGLTEILPVECSCIRMVQLFRGLDRWIENDEYLPRPGDILFYDWQDTGVPEDDRGAPDHVGLVEAVHDSVITVIEGNCSDRVGRRKIAVNGRRIRGYGVPDFRKKAALLSVRELARLTVLDSPEYWTGELLLGQVRYLADLFCRASEVITEKGPRTATGTEGLARLVQGGIIHVPGYWEEMMRRRSSVRDLICALGGSVPV